MIKYHYDLLQGSAEWLAARCGLLTASEMKHIITPARLQYAQNDKERSHVYELAAQRISSYVEPHYVSDDMLRGQGDEFHAKAIYNEKYAGVRDCGFITNDEFGFVLGYSPDGLIGNDGLIECKGRRQKFQVETIISNAMPVEYVIQVQTGLLVSKRKWLDFISYCGGLPMLTKRIFPDAGIQAAIVSAAAIFHDKLLKIIEIYNDVISDPAFRTIPTERIIEGEIVI